MQGTLRLVIAAIIAFALGIFFLPNLVAWAFIAFGVICVTLVFIAVLGYAGGLRGEL